MTLIQGYANEITVFRFDLDVPGFPLRKYYVGFISFISNLAPSITSTLALKLFHKQVSGSLLNLLNLSKTQEACLDKVMKDAILFI